MYLYTEEGRRKNYKTTDIIGGEQYGTIYKLSNEECLKIYKRNKNEINIDILKFIKRLYLKRYYEIYELLYDRNKNFKAHTMRYYEKEEIDVLTEPIDYTLSSLFEILDSVNTLTQNNILINDMHTGNAIINSDGITIIDVDLYTFNRFYSENGLKIKNISALMYLIHEIYLEAINNYHSELKSYDTGELIKSTFRLYTFIDSGETYKKLIKYKYPIDYIRKHTK